MDLSSLQNQLAEHAKSQAQHPTLQGAPVHLWNPAFCGDIDIRIAADGTWFHTGTPITRMPIVRLFSSVLKKEAEDYFLVTPTEKVRIVVEDVPFVITEWQKQDGFLLFTTKEGIQFVVSEENPVELRMNAKIKDTLPYILLRNNLFARLHQNVFYQLAEQGQPLTTEDGKTSLTIKSGNYLFSLGNY